MPTVTVTTSPTLLFAAKPASQRNWLLAEVAAGGAVVYVAPRSDVSPSTGYALTPGSTRPCTLSASGQPALEAWYGIVDSGTQVVRIDDGGSSLPTANDALVAIYRPGLGEPGPQGAPGEKGDPGDTGATGPAGATGAQGAAGAAGATGATGATGAQGIPGPPLVRGFGTRNAEDASTDAVEVIFALSGKVTRPVAVWLVATLNGGDTAQVELHEPVSSVTDVLFTLSSSTAGLAAFPHDATKAAAWLNGLGESHLQVQLNGTTPGSTVTCWAVCEQV